VGSSVIDAVVLASRDALLDALQRGCDPNEAEDGRSALALACLNQSLDLVSDLIRFGADVNAAESDGTTPIFHAAFNGNSILVHALLDAGARTDARNEVGQTPLMVAAKSGSVQTVLLLLRFGSTASARDQNGRNALHWASTGGDFDDVIEALLVAGVDPTDRTIEGDSAIDYAFRLKRDASLAAMTAPRARSH